MSQKLYFAQKAIILNEDKTQILLVYYADSKFTSDKVKGKHGFPGGKIDFGEELDESFIREVEEETGALVKPSLPVDVWTWKYKKGEDDIQIIACSRIAYFLSGELKEIKEENETTLKAVWKGIKDLKEEEVIFDEWPSIKKLLELMKTGTL